jgi:sulfite reductase beta subunit-like hemoprotein
MTTPPYVPDPRGRDFADASDIEAFVQKLREFERGEITSEDWRLFRLSSGSYGQRQEADLHMLRVKIPEGVLDARQMEALADVAEAYARGFAHFTTRQNMQFHFLPMASLEPGMRRLASAGLTTKEACGNTVRNITACPFAGVAHDEAFDVTPYGEALSRYLLRHPLGAHLPRKFKIAFEGCPHDHVLASINDIGFFARVDPDTGQRGFRVTVGGGTATLPVSGAVLRDFLPADEVLGIAEAIVRVFHRHGDREHRKKARMKFLIRKVGLEAFRALVDQALAEVLQEGIPALPFDASNPPAGVPPASQVLAPGLGEIAQIAVTALRGPGLLPEGPEPLAILPSDHEPPLSRATQSSFREWSTTNVREQRQVGYRVVTVRLPLGDITAGQLRVLARLASAFSEASVRTTLGQNVLFRWVRESDVRSLFESLEAAGLARPGAGTLADVTSCPGAESCRLAVTHSRGVADLLTKHLQARPELARQVPGLDIKISGCPNGCGQHHVAGIGLQGSVRQVGGRTVPQYFVMVGGGARDGAAHFARLAAKVPARHLGEAVERLVQLYETERAQGEDAPTFFERVPLPAVQAALAPVSGLDAEALADDDFIDPGSEADATPGARAFS